MKIIIMQYNNFFIQDCFFINNYFFFKRYFKMVWTENMSKHEDPIIGKIY